MQPNPSQRATSTDVPTSKAAPHVVGSVPSEVVHSYRQEHWTAGEVKLLTIRSDATYRFSVTGLTRYFEQGVVTATKDSITFHATTEVDPSLTLDRGQTYRWWIVRDDIGSLEFHLLSPDHDGYGGSDGEDVYYLQ